MDRHKKDLEEKIDRIDKAIETFSKKMVYIAFWKKLFEYFVKYKLNKMLRKSDMFRFSLFEVYQYSQKLTLLILI